MGRSQKSKRVTWASDLNLCQVKLFSLQESPAKVGIKTQDHLRVKAIELDDTLPPGFEGFRPANLRNLKSLRIPSIQWKCPRRFEVNSDWQVVAGEESKEKGAQNQREMRVLEAVYPPPSAIPPNPSAAAITDYSTYNDQNTPVVPLTPIEEDDSSQCNSNTNGIPSATAAMIDPHLLLKLLSNPKMVEELLSNMQKNDPASVVQTMPPIVVPKSTCNIPATTAQYIPPVDMIKNETFYPLQIKTPAPSPCVTKDANYYKRLIQQHGEERRDFNSPQVDHRSDRETFVKTKAKIMKPCVYFNSRKGCRNGANCPYQHDLPSQKRVGDFSKVPAVKRVKLDRGIAGIL